MWGQFSGDEIVAWALSVLYLHNIQIPNIKKSLENCNNISERSDDKIIIGDYNNFPHKLIACYSNITDISDSGVDLNVLVSLSGHVIIEIYDPFANSVSMPNREEMAPITAEFLG